MLLVLAVGLSSRPSYDEGRMTDVVNHPGKGRLDFPYLALNSVAVAGSQYQKLRRMEVGPGPSPVLAVSDPRLEKTAVPVSRPRYLGLAGNECEKGSAG